MKARNSAQEEFWQYHNDNPGIYSWIKHFALQAIAAGHKHYAIASIVERVRWHTNIEMGDDTFKINNTYRPHYARLFMSEYPEHAGFFRTRERKAGV